VARCFEFLAQFSVIVNFAVISNDVTPAFADKRLIGGVRINYSEPDRAKRDIVRLKSSEVIGTSMSKRSCCPLNFSSVKRKKSPRKTCKPTHDVPTTPASP
jgi:hypothetical protein